MYLILDFINLFIKRYPNIQLMSLLYRNFMKQYQRFSNLSSNTKGIWTVILLAYSHIIYTCLSVLHCPNVLQQDGRTSSKVRHRT